MKFNIKLFENKDIKEFFLDRHTQWTVGIIVIMIFASWLYITTSFYYIPDRIIVHITSENIVDVVVTRGELYGVIGVWSILVGINIALSYVLYTRKKTGAYILLYGTIVMALLLCMYAMLITSINV